MPLKATIEWPISSIRPTGTRRVKSWLLAISLIMACMRESGRVICRYSSAPMAVSSRMASPVTMPMAVVVVESVSLSVAMAASF